MLWYPPAADRWLLMLLLTLSTRIHCASIDASVVVVSTVLRNVTDIIDITVDRNENILCVTKANNGTVYRFLPTDGAITFVASGFYLPCGITCDTINNLAYVADTGNYRIRRIDLSNNNAVTTFAGGTPGYLDNTGTLARFNLPRGIVYHSSGVMYVADASYVRKIIITGAVVSTVPTQNTTFFYYYLCVNHDGTLLYATIYNILTRVNTNGSGSLTLNHSDVAFLSPQGIALNNDESVLFIADWSNHRIRKVMLSTSSVTTVAGTGIVGFNDGLGRTASFSSIFGARWWRNGTASGMLVADQNNQAVRFVSIENGTTSSSSSQENSLSTSNSQSSTASHQTTKTLSTSEAVSRSASSSSSSTNTLSPSLTHPPLSVTESVSMSCSFSRTNSPTSTRTQLMSVTQIIVPSYTDKTRSITDSQPYTRSLQTPTATMYCALVPTSNSVSIGSLHGITQITSVQAIPLSPSAISEDHVAGGGLFVSAASLSRQQLLLGLPLVMNISVSLGGTLRGGNVSNDAWTLVDVELSIAPSYGASPLLTSAVVFVANSIDLVGREQFATYVLHASPSWLPASLSTFQSVSLALRFVLRCPANPEVTSDVVVVVPCPGERQEFAAEVKTASSVAQYSTSIAGPSAGAAVGRIASVRSFVLCSETTAVVQGMLSLPIDVCGDSAGADARGALLGNLVLWTAVSGLMAVVVAAYAWAARITFFAAAQVIGAPSQLLPLVVVTVPSTVSGTFYLLHSPACSLDAVLATLGVAMCVSPLAVLSAVAYAVSQHFSTYRTTEATKTNHRGLSLRLLVRALFSRRVRWGDKKLFVDGTATDATFKESAVSCSWLRRSATVFLLEYAKVWYGVLDLAVLTVLGVLGAVSSLESATACRASAMVAMLLVAGQLVVCAAVQPFTTLFSHAFTLFTLAVGTVAAVCQVWFLFGTQASGSDPNSLSRLLTASAVCDVLVSAVSVIRALLDGSDAVRACYRNATKLSYRHIALSLKPAGSSVDAVCSVPSSMEVYNLEATSLREYDDQCEDLGDVTTILSADDGDVVSEGESTSEELLLFEHGSRTQDMLRSFYMPPRDRRNTQRLELSADD